jgi:hypothetical protein
MSFFSPPKVSPSSESSRRLASSQRHSKRGYQQRQKNEAMIPTPAKRRRVIEAAKEAMIPTLANTIAHLPRLHTNGSC